MTRTRLGTTLLLMVGLALCTLLARLGLAAAPLLPFFLLCLLAALLAPLPEAVGTLGCSLVLLGWLLARRTPALAPGVIVQVLIWTAGICGLVLVLAWHLRLQTRRALRRSESQLPPMRPPAPDQLYARLVELAPDGVVVVDEQASIVLFNKQAEKLFGWDRSDVLGAEIAILVPPSKRAKHRRFHEHFIKAGFTRPMGQGLELDGYRRDGSTFPAEIALAPVEISAGGTHHKLVKATVRDVSERKAMEKELIDARIKIEATEQAVREHDAFLSVAAHELKTPLTALLGYAELAGDLAERALRTNGPLPPSYEDLREEALRIGPTLQRQANRMVAMVNRMLEAGRLSTNRMALELSDEDLGPVIVSARDFALSLHPGRTVFLERPPGHFPITADGLRLEQVMINLIDNALKYSPPSEPVHVRLERPPEGGARLCVCDHGSGIPPSERSKVFQRFYQIGARERSTGLGLGLWLSREMVHAHGGTISIEDNPGGGCRVIVWLPQEPPPSERPPQECPPSPSRPGLPRGAS